jgi:uncharacterized membrane protein YhdT
VTEKNEKLDGKTKDVFGGSRLSGFLGFLSWFILLWLLLSLFYRVEDIDPRTGIAVSSRWAWEGTVACTIGWICTSYLSYRLAGGRRNPAISKDKNNQ